MTIHLNNEADVREFAQGFTQYAAGAWHADRWKTFRLRFGIYEQRQAGRYMIRAKIPGGALGFEQARAIAAANTALAGGDIHVTTRQGIQLYFIKEEDLPGIVATLNAGGVTTREASGSTFRAITACPRAGFCPEQKIDAADAARKLTAAWLRDPLTQHMPRKFKTTVSGCAKDCGLSAIDDLGLIAVERDGQNGFRVVAGGGLGIQPTQAVEVFDFVTERDVTRVQEALAKVHHRHSDRTNKNRSRLKFLVKRFGKDGFAQRVREEFDALRAVDARALEALDWRGHVEGASDHVEISVPLGWLSSRQLEGVAALGQRLGAESLRLTRTQNVIVQGLPRSARAALVEGVRGLELEVREGRRPFDDFVVCPGASTCAIGITDSFRLAQNLIDGDDEFQGLTEGVSIRISGCHNSCGHHHIADIGLHGVANKIAGEPVPHYQVHLGGGANRHGVAGPVVPAHRVKAALRLLLSALRDGRLADESVRGWAERVGAAAIDDIVRPALDGIEGDLERLRVDIGHEQPFVPPASATGECAAGAVVAEHLADLARVARFDAQRAIKAGDAELARRHLRLAFQLPLQRLLVISGSADKNNGAEADERAVRSIWAHDRSLIESLSEAKASLGSADAKTALPVLAAWQTAADAEVERILGAIPGFLSKRIAASPAAGGAS